MRFIAALFLCIALIIVVGVVFVGSGVYNIGADSPHWPVTVRIIDALRDRSIAQHDGNVTVPDLEAPELIADGADHYAAMCTGCHLAPGMDDTEMRQGLYPKPPNLAESGIDDPAEAFWFIKHGIKMSAMPAWGLTHDDHKIWGMVAFARKLPQMSAAQYRQMTMRAGSPNEHEHDAMPGMAMPAPAEPATVPAPATTGH